MKRGTTRIVFLIGNYAIKIPYIFKWRLFLRGVLANIDERLWYKASPDEWRLKLCPSLVCIGGLILVSRKAIPITLEEYNKIDDKDYDPLPYDKKLINFGWYNNRIVLIDYADSKYFCSGCELIFTKMKKI